MKCDRCMGYCWVVLPLRAATLILTCFALGCGPDAPPSAKATSAPEFPSLTDMLVIGVVHADYLMCAMHSHSEVCRDEFHWKVELNRREAKDWPRAVAFIQAEAKRLANPRKPGLSDLQTEVAAESGAPYEPIQKALAACEAAGIVKLTLTQFKEKLVDAQASPLGVGLGPELVILVGKQEPPEKIEVRWVEAANLKDAIDAAATQRPRKDLPVVLKPLPETIWGEVMGIRDSCLKWGFPRVDFAAPFKPGGVRK